jgi:hypothetical protein
VEGADVGVLWAAVLADEEVEAVRLEAIHTIWCACLRNSSMRSTSKRPLVAGASCCFSRPSNKGVMFAISLLKRASNRSLANPVVLEGLGCWT